MSDLTLTGTATMSIGKFFKKLEKFKDEFLTKKSAHEELEIFLKKLKKKQKNVEDKLEKGDGNMRRRALKLELKLLSKEIEKTRKLIKKFEQEN